jgi:hypothetical protein
MYGLYKQILDKSKDKKGCIVVDTLIANANMQTEVNNKLISEGYLIQNLNYKAKAILFTALVDIIVVCKDNQYYLATFNQDKIKELANLGRLIPNAGENDLSGVDRIFRNNTKDVICQYLLQDKFHLIKLNLYEKSKTSFTLCSVGTMNPYPSLDVEQVYSLSQISAWHNELYNALVKGIYKLSVGSETYICQNYLSNTKSVVTGGVLVTKDLNNNLLELPIFKIRSYEPYNDNSFIQNLYKGIVEFDGNNITLNREILEKYYGSKVVYSKLESKGVRYRYCLEELLSIGNKYSLAYYINKYALEIYDCNTIYDLQDRLYSLIAKEKSETNEVINARVLTSVNTILAGHKSYYIRINLSKVANHNTKVVENIADVMPKTYQYYAISPSLGYNCVEVNATSDSLAEKYGETEFARQFGKDSKFSGLMCEGKLIKGIKGYKFGIDIQRKLCQSIMLGYKSNYEGYAKVIRKMLDDNNIHNYSDETIQLLYINNLARISKYGEDIKMFDVMQEFIKFCELLNNTADLQKRLVDEKSKISYKMCCKEYSAIQKAFPEFKGYKLDDTPEGKFVLTRYGRYKYNNQGVNKTVELLYNEESLGNKIIKG